MPSLRGLAVSCKNVDDQALSALPDFPALRELMPMDVSDEGFRHVGRCGKLEGLWCMYCRDTGDVATGHISGLSRLKTYYAGKTKITDRSMEILGRMASLERLEFWQCADVTNAGIGHLTGLPRLKEIHLGGMAGVTRDVAALFPARARQLFGIVPDVDFPWLARRSIELTNLRRISHEVSPVAVPGFGFGRDPARRRTR